MFLPIERSILDYLDLLKALLSNNSMDDMLKNVKTSQKSMLILPLHDYKFQKFQVYVFMFWVIFGFYQT
jgi:hypothetical protein